MKIVLHACCGPCSTVPLRDYLSQNKQICIFFANSNIHPQSEYLRRRDTIAAYAKTLGVDFVEGAYSVNRWMDTIGDCKEFGPSRCTLCYRMRFTETAEFAKSYGADAIATSLTISPYQYTDLINSELARAADNHGLTALKADYREQYKQSVEMSREAGMYRQNYCGCIYSLVEAQEQRAAARKARKAAKAAAKTEKGAAGAERVAKVANTLDVKTANISAKEVAVASANEIKETANISVKEQANTSAKEQVNAN